MKKTLLLIFITLFQLSTFAQKEVIVGGYDFPPFVSTSDGVSTGMTIDLIELLNKHQSKYVFKFHLTTSKRRYKDFNDKKYDLIFFEDIAWGWNGEGVSPSNIILTGGEVFITKNVPGRSEDFFKVLKDKTILGMLGYHYKFANLVSDKEYLKKYFNMEFGENHESNILSVIKSERPTIAIVTKAYLNQFLSENSGLKDKLLISNTVDQHYNHTILLRNNTTPNIFEINGFIKALEKNGELDTVWSKYGVKK